MSRTSSNPLERAKNDNFPACNVDDQRIVFGSD